MEKGLTAKFLIRFYLIKEIDISLSETDTILQGQQESKEATTYRKISDTEQKHNNGPHNNYCRLLSVLKRFDAHDNVKYRMA